MLLSPDRQTRVPWKNGGGVSTIIADERQPGSTAGDWAGVIWQFGRTSIVASGPFSDLSGFERLQTVIGGEGLFLDTPAGVIDLSRPLTVARYDGGTPIVSRLARGPVEVVNLIGRRDMVDIDMRVLRPGDALPAGEGAVLLHAPAGAASLALAGEPVALPESHALRLGRPTEAACVAGVVLAATIARRHVS